jgi:hypothetical protein
MTEEQPREKLVIDSLPPIHMVKMPATMRVMSTKIRWLAALGYPRAEIQKQLGLRYQQVRNVLHNLPKRAAREDLPPLVIELYDPVDDIQAIMDSELEKSMKVVRKERAKATYDHKYGSKSNGQDDPEDEEVDEITEQDDG